MAWLVLSASDHEVLGLNLAGGRIQLMIVRCFISQSFLLSPFHHLDDLNNVERDIKCQTIINFRGLDIVCKCLAKWPFFTRETIFYDFLFAL